MTFEKMVIRRGHPKHIILGTVGFLWFVYFVWRHEWIWALGIVLASAILGRVATLGTREEGLGQMLLGRMAFLHLHPVNLTLQFAGFAILLYGIWMHGLVHILVGASLVLLGHMWGWHKVNEAL